MISSPGSAKLCATIAMPWVDPVNTMMLAGVIVAAPRAFMRSAIAARNGSYPSESPYESTKRGSRATRPNDFASSPSGEGSSGATP